MVWARWTFVDSDKEVGAGLAEEFPESLPVWHAFFREARAKRRAVEWLADEGLIAKTPPISVARVTPTQTCPGHGAS